MTELEKYIQANIDSIDCEEIPGGSKERFLRKIDGTARTRRLLHVLAVPAAAAIAFLIYTSSPSTLERELRNLAMQEVEVLTLVNETHPEELEDVQEIIKSITFEAIPIEDLLPEEISQKERDRIIKEYYQHQAEAVAELMKIYQANE